MKLCIFILCFFSSMAYAEKLQILHTNDVHSFLDHSGKSKDRGGYARLKSLFDKYKAWGERQGIKTIIVDAGDFMEGNLFYMADKGQKSFDILDQVGYDVVTIGNHDFLMGTKDLDKIVGKGKTKFSLLGANVRVHAKYKNLKKYLKPYKEFNVGKYKVAFMGLTTDEKIYKWRLNNGNITNPIVKGMELEEHLKERGNDLIISLNHLGLNDDKRLVKKTKNIDLVIGGHSHHLLKQPLFRKNKLRRNIPILQAGEHGDMMGRIILDIDKTGIRNIDKYEVIPVVDVESDQLISEYVEEAKNDLYRLYGENYLKEIIGISKLDREKVIKHTKVWNSFVADAIREDAHADVSINATDLTGTNYPVGDVSRQGLYDGHPRFFELKNSKGWYIYKAQMKGYLLKFVFQIAMKFGVPLTFSGVSFDWHKSSLGKYRVSNIKIRGKRINPFKKYSISLPEGVVRGAYSISFLTRFLIRRGHKTSTPIIEAIESKFSREKIVEENYKLKRGVSGIEKNIDYIHFPGAKR